MEVKFNVNLHVKVKLTPFGKAVHQQKHDLFWKGRFKYIPPVEDEDGYSKWQLWSLMEKFGEYMGLCQELPFETDIIFITE